jgi:hypothetical protein
MLRAGISGEAWFDGLSWAEAAQARPAVQRAPRAAE